MMRHATHLAVMLSIAAAPVHSAPAKKPRDAAYREDRAVIVVTGMRVNEDPADYRVDPSVAEGATVKLTAADGTVTEKKTEPFSRAGGKGANHRSADFVVDLDAAYTITMRFQDGTTIRIDDYRIPKEWKTHFYFHSTTGTLSPSSILRFAEDPRTKLRCCIYAVYPMESYRKLGGRQLQ